MARALRSRPLWQVLLLASLCVALLGADWRCGQRAGVFGLTADSTLADGCFAPLRCPVRLAESVGGTFRLEQIAQAATNAERFDTYSVNDVYWLARLGGEDVPITGGGLYRVGDESQKLTLWLRMGDGAVERFDSGTVPLETFDLSRIDVTVSKNGGAYLDTVIRLRAIAFPVAANNETPCGPSGLVCDTRTEVCVARSPIGPAIVHDCEPVPAGCDEDRTCGCAGLDLCQAPFGACFDRGENSIECMCLQCQ